MRQIKTIESEIEKRQKKIKDLEHERDLAKIDLRDLKIIKKTAIKGRPTPLKSNSLEFMRRIELTVMALAKGHSTSSIIKWGYDTFGVRSRAVESYISEAKRLIKKNSKSKIDVDIADYRNRMNYLYAKMVEKGNYRGALKVVEALAKLTGAYPVIPIVGDPDKPIGLSLGYNSDLTPEEKARVAEVEKAIGFDTIMIEKIKLNEVENEDSEDSD